MPRWCQLIAVSGLTIVIASTIRGEESVQPHRDEAIGVQQPHSRWGFAAQDDQLPAQVENLGLKSRVLNSDRMTSRSLVRNSTIGGSSITARPARHPDEVFGSDKCGSITAGSHCHGITAFISPRTRSRLVTSPFCSQAIDANVRWSPITPPPHPIVRPA
jgi:hypothetical protein